MLTLLFFFIMCFQNNLYLTKNKTQTSTLVQIEYVVWNNIISSHAIFF